MCDSRLEHFFERSDLGVTATETTAAGVVSVVQRDPEGDRVSEETRLDGPIMGSDRISWWEKTGVRHARVSSAVRLQDVMPTKRARKASKYRGQLNFQGHYWFEGANALVWHESMTEYAWLMMFDHLREIRAVSPQPFVLAFADGTTHVPDYMMRNAFGDTTVMDVHPEELTTDRDREVFSATQRVCDQLGWEFVLRGAMPDVTAWNLEMIARYRHPMFQPTSDVRHLILETVARTPRMGDIRRGLETDKPGEHIAALMHLMWQRHIVIDLHSPFTDAAHVAVA